MHYSFIKHLVHVTGDRGLEIRGISVLVMRSLAV